MGLNLILYTQGVLGYPKCLFFLSSLIVFRNRSNINNNQELERLDPPQLITYNNMQLKLAFPSTSQSSNDLLI